MTLRITVTGAIAIIVFDVLAAFASARVGFAYEKAVSGSYIIQAVTGFIAGRAMRRATAGAVAAAGVGFVEATLGWALSTLVGPVVTSTVALTPVLIVVTVIVSVLLAAAVGWIGGFAGSRVAPSVAPAP